MNPFYLHSCGFRSDHKNQVDHSKQLPYLSIVTNLKTNYSFHLYSFLLSNLLHFLIVQSHWKHIR